MHTKLTQQSYSLFEILPKCTLHRENPVLGSAQNFGHQKGNEYPVQWCQPLLRHCYGLDMTGLQSDFRGN
jgi:hypothetical protein